MPVETLGHLVGLVEAEEAGDVGGAVGMAAACGALAADGGGGGATAAPIAGAVIEAYLADRLRRNPEMAATNDSTLSESEL